MGSAIYSAARKIMRFLRVEFIAEPQPGKNMSHDALLITVHDVSGIDPRPLPVRLQTLAEWASANLGLRLVQSDAGRSDVQWGALIVSNTQRLLTTAQAAKVLDIKPGTLRRWRAKKRGPAAIKYDDNRQAAGSGCVHRLTQSRTEA